MSWRDVGLTRMLLDWLHDPQRRKQVCARVVESYYPAIPWALYIWGWWGILGALLAPLGEFLLYEFVLEPFWPWVGPYWERGPREGKTFVKW